ncbi:unnamed protein product [Ilex paraguariensis]|uniref:Plastid lipid-associated protein/fibrillin conserved domain-containing protein n=1 Tax=Ilex paraguariensis TaxID=185542 RepID=A0ABC8UHW3_9AQUA
MASVLQSRLPLYHSSPSPSSYCSSTFTCFFPINPRAQSIHTQMFHSKKNYHSKKDLLCKSALDKVSVIDPPGNDVEGSKTEIIGALKLKLLSAVSGLNRGLAASEDDLQKADSAAKELEGVGGPVDLSVELDKLQGRWKLIYSSAFSSRTLGGSRPGPPTGRLLPIILGQVCLKKALAFCAFICLALKFQMIQYNQIHWMRRK